MWIVLLLFIIHATNSASSTETISPVDSSLSARHLKPRAEAGASCFQDDGQVINQRLRQISEIAHWAVLGARYRLPDEYAHGSFERRFGIPRRQRAARRPIVRRFENLDYVAGLGATIRLLAPERFRGEIIVDCEYLAARNAICRQRQFVAWSRDRGWTITVCPAFWQLPPAPVRGRPLTKWNQISALLVGLMLTGYVVRRSRVGVLHSEDLPRYLQYGNDLYLRVAGPYVDPHID